MNERFLEIAKQAGLKFPSETALSPMEEKFGELLIQEAIKVVQRRYMGDNNREDMEVRRCVADLKNHFGVEE